MKSMNHDCCLQSWGIEFPGKTVENKATLTRQQNMIHGSRTMTIALEKIVWKVPAQIFESKSLYFVVVKKMFADCF